MALFHRLAAQRVQYDVDPGAVRDRAHRIGKAEIARIQDMVGAGQPQEATFDLRPRAGDDDSPAVFGVLDRGEPDATGGGMDQHVLAGTELAERSEGVDGGDKGHRYRRSGREARFFGDRHHRMRGGNHLAAQRRRGEARHSVADFQARYAGPDPANNAGAFETEGGAGEAVDQGLFGQQTHTPHHVAEIQARRVYLDSHFARSRLALFRKLPAE